MAKASPAAVFSHWYTLIENLQTSPMEFYASVGKAIERRQVPDAKTDRIDWKEGGVFSAKREYLRVRRKEYLFDICGAPFGTGFFISWWLGEVPSGLWALLSDLPAIGWFFRLFIRPATYYKIDTALMFQTAIHSAVLEVIDEITKTKGLRALSELERKPILKELMMGAAV